MTSRLASEPIAPERLEILPATLDRWADVVTLLGGDGERGCWCQAWRGSDSPLGRGDPARNRMLAESQLAESQLAESQLAESKLAESQLAMDDVAPGLIAYLDGDPVGWCGLGPRAAMPRLVRSRTIPNIDDLPVWSIGCFRIRVGYRRRGVARALLAGAVDYARQMGAPAVEAYPIDAEGERVDVGFGFVGFTSTFEAAGFRRVTVTDAHSAGRVRWLMRLDLDPETA